ncbi:hypothetical protein FA95DRAFT_561574 [Auriscalpium vulgare]|uniref:Uncharacterized protein n=1 Tax=Auriscalpium vulgare TaxID=40419 RepID=A0ACB8REJ8_9AGAM|nr:hypothetical protein FA95DRAFT_561574 [Auriscalpium vulgare]
MPATSPITNAATEPSSTDGEQSTPALTAAATSSQRETAEGVAELLNALGINIAEGDLDHPQDQSLDESVQRQDHLDEDEPVQREPTDERESQPATALPPAVRSEASLTRLEAVLMQRMVVVARREQQLVIYRKEWKEGQARLEAVREAVHREQMDAVDGREKRLNDEHNDWKERLGRLDAAREAVHRERMTALVREQERLEAERKEWKEAQEKLEAAREAAHRERMDTLDRREESVRAQEDALGRMGIIQRVLNGRLT